jgi:DNA-binding LacI/PurR family transcriptional regulator
VSQNIKQNVECEFGVVKKVWLSENKVYLIHTPMWTETARKIEEELSKEGYDVVRLNVGVDYEAERADELLELCFQSEQ